MGLSVAMATILASAMSKGASASMCVVSVSVRTPLRSARPDHQGGEKLLWLSRPHLPPRPLVRPQVMLKTFA